jgi:hypothetical protein
MNNHRSSGMRRVFIAAFCVAISAASFALPQASSASYKISYSSTPAGGAHLTSTSFQARAAAIGLTQQPIQSTLPVVMSTFSLA